MFTDCLEDIRYNYMKTIGQHDKDHSYLAESTMGSYTLNSRPQHYGQLHSAQQIVAQHHELQHSQTVSRPWTATQWPATLFQEPWTATQWTPDYFSTMDSCTVDTRQFQHYGQLHSGHQPISAPWTAAQWTPDYFRTMDSCTVDTMQFQHHGQLHSGHRPVSAPWTDIPYSRPSANYNHQNVYLVTYRLNSCLNYTQWISQPWIMHAYMLRYL